LPWYLRHQGLWLLHQEERMLSFSAQRQDTLCALTAWYLLNPLPPPPGNILACETKIIPTNKITYKLFSKFYNKTFFKRSSLTCQSLVIHRELDSGSSSDAKIHGSSKCLMQNGQDRTSLDSQTAELVCYEYTLQISSSLFSTTYPVRTFI
jgi:hypothetical protein